MGKTRLQESLEARRAECDIVIEFGAPGCQPYLGGSFYGPENENGVSWNWAGTGTCWCVLPQLESDCDYAMRLEIAAMTPFNAELWQLVLRTGTTPLLDRILPATGNELVSKIRLSPEMVSSLEQGNEIEVCWRRVPTPLLHIRAGDLPIATLEFETRPDMQVFNVLLRRQTIGENTVLIFEPGISLSMNQLDPEQDRRELSFRFYRLILRKLT